MPIGRCYKVDALFPLNWCYGAMGYMTEQVDAHNEVTLITFCKNHLKAVGVPFEDELPYNKHKYFLFFPSFIFPVFVNYGSRQGVPVRLLARHAPPAS